MCQEAKPLNNTSKIHQYSRVSFLIVISFFIVTALGKLIIFPTRSASKIFIFPSTVSLPGWQSLQSKSITKDILVTSQAPTFVSGKKYRFTKNTLSLDIDMGYIAGGSGNIREFAKNYNGISDETVFSIQEYPEIGYYYQYIFEERAYLSTCINPHGSSTINLQQFQKARFANPVWPRHVLPVLLGQESFWDDRCLWTEMSVPLKSVSVEQAYKELNSAWLPWFKWWNSHYPRP